MSQLLDVRRAGSEWRPILAKPGFDRTDEELRVLGTLLHSLQLPVFANCQVRGIHWRMRLYRVFFSPSIFAFFVMIFCVESQFHSHFSLLMVYFGPVVWPKHTGGRADRNGRIPGIGNLGCGHDRV